MAEGSDMWGKLYPGVMERKEHRDKKGGRASTMEMGRGAEREGRGQDHAWEQRD